MEWRKQEARLSAGEREGVVFEWRSAHASIASHFSGVSGEVESAVEVVEWVVECELEAELECELLCACTCPLGNASAASRLSTRYALRSKAATES